MQEWEARKFIIEMTDESFSRFCEQLTDDQKRVLLEMRAFHKLFQDPDFYKAVQQAVGEAFYEEINRRRDLYEKFRETTISRGADASL